VEEIDAVNIYWASRLAMSRHRRPGRNARARPDRRAAPQGTGSGGFDTRRIPAAMRCRRMENSSSRPAPERFRRRALEPGAAARVAEFRSIRQRCPADPCATQERQSLRGLRPAEGESRSGHARPGWTCLACLSIWPRWKRFS
jgi:hypothetical protein